jgi:hypothetical protein
MVLFAEIFETGGGLITSSRKPHESPAPPHSGPVSFGGMSANIGIHAVTQC